MKKITLFVLISLVLVGLLGCSSVQTQEGASYKVLLLGDMHYDSNDFRKDVEGLAANRKKELARNLKRWEAHIPAMIADASGVTTTTAFGVQLGDITQGDCGEGSLHEKAFLSVLDKLSCLKPADAENWRLFVVKGNHDIRGPGAKEAFNNVMLSYLEKQFGQACPVKGRADFARMQGPDLYLFFDSIGSSEKELQFVEKALEAHKDARHVFFLTHLPVLPSSRSYHVFWLVFEKQPALRRRLLELLAARNAIVLAAHIHTTTLETYHSEAGAITQFCSFAMADSWSEGKTHTSTDAMKDLDAVMEKHGTKNPDALADFKGKLEGYTVYAPTSSYNVMHVTPNQVTVERHTGPGESLQPILLKKYTTHLHDA